jgi:glycosyltransferase involved in cell wall biosynthesis
MRKILLVTDYPLDGFRSMDRYADLLCSGLRSRGYTVATLAPRQIIPSELAKNHGLAKWTGYFSKFFLFPFELQFRAQQSDIVHICDHHNATYSFVLSSRPNLITCHDMVGIKASLKENSPAKLSKIGKWLHRANLAGLRRAEMVVCVSKTTELDVIRLTGKSDPESVRVIENALDPTFSPMTSKEANQQIETFGIASTDEYILTVGSDLPRKNRETVLQVVARTKSDWSGKLVIVGAPLSDSSRLRSSELGIAHRLVEVVSPTDTQLRALYSRALGLLYPSLAEGFGWPVIEAQSCQCPVITSNIPPLTYVSGDAALLVDPTDVEELSRQLLRLQEPEVRLNLITAGVDNAAKYSVSRMTDAFISLYSELIEKHAKKH